MIADDRSTMTGLLGRLAKRYLVRARSKGAAVWRFVVQARVQP
jgi:hypothetical protein